jgi:hypothetical protein
MWYCQGKEICITNDFTEMNYSVTFINTEIQSMEERFRTASVRLCLMELEQGKIRLAPDDFLKGLMI